MGRNCADDGTKHPGYRRTVCRSNYKLLSEEAAYTWLYKKKVPYKLALNDEQSSSPLERLPGLPVNRWLGIVRTKSKEEKRPPQNLT